ncbi:MAG: glutamine--tRNA ligase/YqeY domain fusion protein [Bacteroidales bacterium]
MNDTSQEKESIKSLNFIQAIIEEDLRQGKNEKRVHTRFPPEPNGYLHIGHAKSICLNFGLAQQYGGKCNLRFDDTNPTKEEVEYVDSIKEDVHWLGFDWEDREYYASDYFEILYDYAITIIKKGKAFVCDMSAEEISANRGTPTRPGKESPYRDRSIEENLDLFRRMRAGEFKEGSRTLRAKIDMSSPNMHMRDPVMYRIMFDHHHRTGDKWCIYPTYDFAHGQSDYIERITHSVCTLEFEVHRPLYDWFLDQITEPGSYRPHQYEFARLNLSYTIMSKRKLLELVREKYVNGWDDPRMPTISGLRRRGYTPESIRYFADKIGVAKRDNVIDVALLEHSIREDLNKRALRRMAVIRPVKLIIDNYPDGLVEYMDATNNPEDPESGVRKMPFSKELYIERDDFMEDAPSKFFRLKPGGEVRLKYAYIVKCEYVEKDKDGNVEVIHCSYDPETRSGMPQSNRKVKATIHWLSAAHSKLAEIRLFDRLFTIEMPDEVEEGKDYKDYLNPDSLEVVQGFVEDSFQDVKALDKFQFERLGYFCVDPDADANKLIFNRTVTLKDAWAKIERKQS